MKMGVEHLFLFDDDTKPANPEWWRPYVDSPEPHLQHSWTHFFNGRAVDKMSVLHTTPQTTAYTWSMGCMLYAHRDVINRVGGMRECFAPAIHEHIEWSLRIHNAGLTTWPYQDIPGSADLIDAADRYQTVKSSINLDRQKQLHRNDELLQIHKQSSDYVSYGTENVVLSCLFTSQPDPQRGTVMQPNPALAATLLKSLAGINTTVLCDFPTEEPQFELAQSVGKVVFPAEVRARCGAVTAGKRRASNRHHRRGPAGAAPLASHCFTGRFGVVQFPHFGHVQFPPLRKERLSGRVAPERPCREVTAHDGPVLDIGA